MFLLGNRDTRVVLLTGEPGLAPAHEVMRDYDINDYWAKSELSAERLLTVLTQLGFALGSLAPSLGVLLLVFCGLVGAGVGIAALIGASVAAWMFDLFQSYAAPIAGSALLAVLSAVCLAMAGRQASRRIDCLPEKSVA